MSRADAHSTAPRADQSARGDKVDKESTPPQVSEGGDCTRKPRLLRPRTEFQHRVEAMVFLAVDHNPSLYGKKKKEREEKKYRQKAYSTQYSQVVSHPSPNQA